MYPKMKSYVVCALAALAVTSASGCRRRSEVPDPGIPYASSTTSPKLATFIYKEEGRHYLMTVGVNATRFHDKDEFIPLTVVLANRTTTPLHIHRESFTLVDPTNGARYGLASVNEVRRQGKQLYDRKLMDVEHLLGKLSPYKGADADFFAYQRTLVDDVELHQFQFILDNLYFPRPEGELLGKTFELHVDAKGLQEPLFVVFMVPEK